MQRPGFKKYLLPVHKNILKIGIAVFAIAVIISGAKIFNIFKSESSPAVPYGSFSPSSPNAFSKTSTVKGNVQLTQNSMSDYYFKKGSTSTFNGTLENYSSVQITFSADIIISNSQNQRITDKKFSNITLDPSETKTISMDTPPTLNPGTYFVNVGIYDSSGKQISWFPRYQNFKISP